MDLSSRESIIMRNWRIILIGLFIRLIFAPFTGHPYDLPIWMDSGRLLASGLSPYSTLIHPGQTILFSLWTAISYIIASTVNVFLPYSYIFFIKLLPIVADLAIPVAIILLINEYYEKKMDLQKEKFIFRAILYNPLLIIASSFWAMTDSLAFLFFLFSVTFTLRENYIRGSLLLSISIALKLYPVIFLPVFFLIILQRNHFIFSMLFSGLSVGIFIIVAYAPFYIWSWDPMEITGVLSSQLTRTPGGITPLGIITSLSADNPFSDLFLAFLNFIISFPIISFWIIALMILTLIYLFKGYKDQQRNEDRDDLEKIVELSITYFLVWVLTTTWVSEQNISFLVLLLLFKSIIVESKQQTTNKLAGAYWTLSLITFAFLFFNAPIIAFFYLFFDQALISLIMNPILLSSRAFAMVGIAILFLINALHLFSFFDKQRYDKLFEKANHLGFSIVFGIIISSGFFMFLTVNNQFQIFLRRSISLLVLLLLTGIAYKLVANIKSTTTTTGSTTSKTQEFFTNGK